jgi:ribose/xylose/arabinose/galactoside ABC-type transport system permease subunit
MAMMTGGIDLSVVGMANLSAVVAALILTPTRGAGGCGRGGGLVAVRRDDLLAR